MCGFVALYSNSGLGRRDAVVQQMTDVLTHRGPDDSGFFSDSHAVMGFRRLKILDLTASGHQPMSNEDESLWVVFNGEIYNYLDLRNELRSKGHSFKSTSDTEVLLHLYEETGTDMVNRLRGMFAFLIYDAKENTLFGARDPLGKKPLYCYSENGSHIFVSELKALLALPSFDRVVDAQSVSDFLTFGSVPSHRTIFQKVRSVPSGTTVTVRDGKLTLSQYWSISGPESRAIPTDERVVKEQLREKVEESVRIRLRSDVPLGAFLSGGVDSSIIVGVMSKYLDSPVETISVHYEEGGEAYNEDRFARGVSAQFKTNHHEVLVTSGDVSDHLKRIIWHMDQPSSDGLNSYFVSMAARQFVAVTLSGVGGDELFGGYGAFGFIERTQAFAHLSKLASAIYPTHLRSRLQDLVQQGGISSWYRKAGLCAAGLFTSIPERFLLAQSFYTDQEKADLAANGSELPPSVSSWLKSLQNLSQFDAVNQTSILELQHFCQPTLLRDGDVMSMAHSVELRAPFMDQELVKLALTIPGSMKLTNKESKWILKEAFRDLILPEVRTRKKMGFVFPLPLWIKSSRLREVVEDCLSAETVRKRGWFKPDRVQKLYARFRSTDISLPRSHQIFQRIWMLVVLELWARAYLDESYKK